MDKSKVIEAFEQQIRESIDNLRKRDLELASAAQSEEEYGAERLMTKQEELLDEATANDSVQNAMDAALLAINNIEKRHYDTVESGALVLTDFNNFLICTALRQIEVNGEQVVGISMQAPIFQALEGKRAGDVVEFNGNKITIREIA